MFMRMRNAREYAGTIAVYILIGTVIARHQIYALPQIKPGAEPSPAEDLSFVQVNKTIDDVLDPTIPTLTCDLFAPRYRMGFLKVAGAKKMDTSALELISYFNEFLQKKTGTLDQRYSMPLENLYISIAPKPQIISGQAGINNVPEYSKRSTGSSDLLVREENTRLVIQIADAASCMETLALYLWNKGGMLETGYVIIDTDFADWRVADGMIELSR